MSEQSWIDAATRIVERHQYEKVDGVLLDATTANALMTVDRALSAANRERFRAMPLVQAVNVAWKLLK